MSDELDRLLPRIRSGDVTALAEFIEASRHRLLAFIERQIGTEIGRAHV